jgi:ATP-dependent DNA helicase RecG
MIINPGGFPKGVNVNNLLTVSSTPRCRLMAEIMEKTGLVERSGQGVDKIYSITLSEGKHVPDYTQTSLYQVTLVLDSTVIDKSFYTFINHIQSNRPSDNKLGVEVIIALYKIKNGHYEEVNQTMVTWLIDQQFIKRAKGQSIKYLLANEYEQLAQKEHKIGTRYVVLEVERIVNVLQGKSLKIGELEEQLSGSLKRNQIRYLVNKLQLDQVLTAEGTGKGTRYKLENRFIDKRGPELIDHVVTHLRQAAE